MKELASSLERNISNIRFSLNDKLHVMINPNSLPNREIVSIGLIYNIFDRFFRDLPVTNILDNNRNIILKNRIALLKILAYKQQL